MLQYLLYGICTMNQSDREGLRYPDKLALACTARGCAGTLLADERRQASSGEATVRPQVTGPMQWLHAGLICCCSRALVHVRDSSHAKRSQPAIAAAVEQQGLRCNIIACGTLPS